MSKIIWDAIGERTFETGVDHGVLYLQKNGAYPAGVGWSGLTGVTESPSGAEKNAIYADNMKYLNLTSAEEFGATIECVTFPKEWEKCDGSAELAPGVTLGQQRRHNFGFCYRTKKGNDTEGQDYGYKLHLIYGAEASPSEKAYTTINDNPEAITFSYEISTTPITIDGKDEDGKPFAPVASITIDSTTVDADKLAALETILYGTDGTGEGSEGTTARLPLPSELVEIFAEG